MANMVEMRFKCKNCGFDQVYTRNLDYPQGRVTCQNCGAVIVRKRPEPRPQRILIVNKYNTRCRKCKRFLRVGAMVWWTPTKRGVLCKSCKGGNKEPITLDYKK